MIHWLYETFVPPGDGVIGGAIFTVVFWIVTVKLAHVFVWKRHMRPHIERTKELHAKTSEIHKHLGLRRDEA